MQRIFPGLHIDIVRHLACQGALPTIGQFQTAEENTVWFETGDSVVECREDRRSTRSRWSFLFPDNADMVRHYYKGQRPCESTSR